MPEGQRVVRCTGSSESCEAKTMLILRGVPGTGGYYEDCTCPIAEHTHTHTKGVQTSMYM